jgi:alpha-L-rhamnosidase
MVRGFVWAAIFCIAMGELHAAPVKLQVEQRANPLGIDVMRPVLSWQSDSVERGWKQSGYRVRVASTAAGLASGKADVWDSGRVDSSESVGIAYAGPELKARQRYFWSVEVWDGQGRSSKPAVAAWWEMGLIAPGDWSAKWIRRVDPEEDKELKEIRWIALPNAEAVPSAQPVQAEFRYSLHLSKRPFGASLHVSAPGTFVAKVNGCRRERRRSGVRFRDRRSPGG